MLDKTSDISIEWGDAAWFTWRWVMDGLTQIKIAEECGYSGSAMVCSKIAAFIQFWGYWEAGRDFREVALTEYIKAGGVLTKPEHTSWAATHMAASLEHAFLMRCDGETYAQIGKRFGLSSERIRHMVVRRTSQLNRAMRRTKFRFAGRA